MTPSRLALAWALVIWVACSVPSPEAPVGFLPLSFDKWVHVGLFAVLGFLWARAVPGRTWQVLIGGIAFGVAIELWQGLPLVGRTPDAADALADAVGVVLGLGAWRWRSNDPAEEVSG